MEQLTDLKAILHSKRANIYYLEMCRVMQKDGRVLYLTESKNENHYWNIPIANTTVILLGTGTSITQAAVRMLASAGVMIGFSGGGSTPFIAASEIEWLSPQSEYRPTAYVQGWMSFWFDDQKRLQAAKTLQSARINYMKTVWAKDRDLKDQGFVLDNSISKALDDFSQRVSSATRVGELLLTEAQLTKRLYKIAVNHTNHGEFSRDHDSQDTEQEFRQQCLQNFTKHKALDFMFDQVKHIATATDWQHEVPQLEKP
jgi:CRISPR-associated protein Cas1